jgi:hypothetical protein
LIRVRMRIAKSRNGLGSSKWSVRNDLFVPPNVNGQLNLF